MMGASLRRLIVDSLRHVSLHSRRSLPGLTIVSLSPLTHSDPTLGPKGNSEEGEHRATIRIASLPPFARDLWHRFPVPPRATRAFGCSLTHLHMADVDQGNHCSPNPL